MSERSSADLGGTGGLAGGSPMETGRTPGVRGTDASVGNLGGIGATGGLADVAGSQSTGVVDQAKDKAQQLAGQAKEQATQKVESGLQRGKGRAADAIGGVAQTLLQSSQQLRDQNQGAGQYVEQAAHRLQGLSDYLRNTDVHEIIDNVEATARRQPALFLGGAFALGLLGARFLKSSRRDQGQSGQRLSGGSYGGAPYGNAYGGTYGGGTYGGGAYGGTTSGGAYGGTSGSSGTYGGRDYGSGAYGSGTSGYGSTGGTTDDVTPRSSGPDDLR